MLDYRIPQFVAADGTQEQKLALKGEKNPWKWSSQNGRFRAQCPTVKGFIYLSLLAGYIKEKL